MSVSGAGMKHLRNLGAAMYFGLICDIPKLRLPSHDIRETV